MIIKILKVEKYKLKEDVIVLDKLLLANEFVYIEHYDPVNGRLQRIFDSSKILLGKTTSDFFKKLIKIMAKQQKYN